VAPRFGFTARFHQGLNLLVSYTYSKFLDNVDGANDWAVVGTQGAQKYYNLAGENRWTVKIRHTV
jgi:hypothetical protein